MRLVKASAKRFFCPLGVHAPVKCREKRDKDAIRAGEKGRAAAAAACSAEIKVRARARKRNARKGIIEELGIRVISRWWPRGGKSFFILRGEGKTGGYYASALEGPRCKSSPRGINYWPV